MSEIVRECVECRNAVTADQNYGDEDHPLCGDCYEEARAEADEANDEEDEEEEKE